MPPVEAFSADRALCWFRRDASDCLERIADLALLLERAGLRVTSQYARVPPGFVTYRDSNQVVVLPECEIRRELDAAAGRLHLQKSMGRAE